MAWELMTRVYGLDPARLWITVFREDDEAERIWVREAGLPAERVLRMDEADNFWSMGRRGLAAPAPRSTSTGGAARLREARLRRGVLLRPFHGALEPGLHRIRSAEGRDPAAAGGQGVDTGMGLERIASALQG